MRPRTLLLICLLVLALAVMPLPVAAADGDTSTASILSFSATNPSDGNDFLPDGYNSTTTNSKLYDNMAGVGPWVADGLTGGQTRTTTGDYIALKLKYTAGTLWKGMYSNRVSFTTASLDNTYMVLRYKGNVTGATWWGCDFYSSDSKGGTLGKSLTLTQSTSWTTRRVYMGDDAQNAESIWLGAKIDSGQAAVEIDYDFLLLTPSNLDGWQNDCSGTSNITNTGGNTLSSDGDKITISRSAAGSGSTYLLVDNTTTTAGIDSTYYPLAEFAITAVTGSVSVGGDYGAGSYMFGAPSAVTTRYNAESAVSTDWTSIKINVLQGGSITLDYVAFYAISNFTTTVTGATVDDVAYVSSNALVVDKASATLFLFDRDPAISVASATYSRWNITTASPDAVGCALYVAAWTAKDGESTWAMPSGTTTDVRIRVTADATISALKFLADSSAPACVWSSVTPSDPTTTDPVSLWAVITDSYALYKVYFRPITYPMGFSVEDYEAAEQQDNLWLYTFSVLPLAGTYCFKIVGTDGANNNTLGDTTYVTLTVREANIELSSISYFGVGSDFSEMTYSFYSNKDCNYTITEWTLLVAASDTWTGTVTAEAINNIAWDKLDTEENTVWFNLTLESGSLTEVIQGQYQQAQTTFYIKYWSPCLDSYEAFGISGLITKTANYSVYEDDLATATTTGTLADNEFTIAWTKLGVPGMHTFAVKFTNGSQTTFANGTYYKYMYDPDKPELGGAGFGGWRTDEKFWIFVLGIAAVAGVLLIVGRVYGIDFDKMMGMNR